MIDRIRTYFRRRRLRRLGFEVFDWTEDAGRHLNSVLEGSVVLDTDEFLRRETFFGYQELESRGPDVPRSGSRIIFERVVEW